MITPCKPHIVLTGCEWHTSHHSPVAWHCSARVDRTRRISREPGVTRANREGRLRARELNRRRHARVIPAGTRRWLCLHGLVLAQCIGCGEPSSTGVVPRVDVSSGPKRAAPLSRPRPLEGTPSKGLPRVRTDEIEMAIPTGYEDATAKLAIPNASFTLLFREWVMGFQPSIVLPRIVPLGGSFADPGKCRASGMSLTADPTWRLLTAKVIDGPLGKACQIHLRAPEGRHELAEGLPRSPRERAPAAVTPALARTATSLPFQATRPREARGRDPLTGCRTNV